MRGLGHSTLAPSTAVTLTKCGLFHLTGWIRTRWWLAATSLIAPICTSTGAHGRDASRSEYARAGAPSRRLSSGLCGPSLVAQHELKR
jgi:hypothetical protein